MSASRGGVSPTYDWLSGNQPTTSMMTSTPPPLLKTEILPLVPTLVITALATVWPGTKLRFDASGRAGTGGPHREEGAQRRVGDRDVQCNGADTTGRHVAATEDGHRRLDTLADLARSGVLAIDRGRVSGLDDAEVTLQQGARRPRKRSPLKLRAFDSRQYSRIRSNR